MKYDNLDDRLADAASLLDLLPRGLPDGDPLKKNEANLLAEYVSHLAQWAHSDPHAIEARGTVEQWTNGDCALDALVELFPSPRDRVRIIFAAQKAGYKRPWNRDTGR